jgi:hypothetical protein
MKIQKQPVQQRLKKQELVAADTADTVATE